MSASELKLFLEKTSMIINKTMLFPHNIIIIILVHVNKICKYQYLQLN